MRLGGKKMKMRTVRNKLSGKKGDVHKVATLALFVLDIASTGLWHVAFIPHRGGARHGTDKARRCMGIRTTSDLSC